jgi:hypothetical protein
MRPRRTSFVRRWLAAVLTGVSLIALGLGGWYWTVTRRFVEGTEHARDGIVATPVRQHLLFTNVNVWDGTSDRVRTGTSLEVRDGLIVSVHSVANPHVSPVL